MGRSASAASAHARLDALRLARRARGFTLVELMLALLAGLFVAMAAFVLSRNASRFFQHEARISSAQLAATLGMNRIAADLQRAGFLSTPNIQRDPARCGGPAGWPTGLTQLAGVTIVNGGSATAHGAELDQSTKNGLSPDSLVIGGAFNSTEQFPVRTILTGGGAGTVVLLQMDSGPMVRALNAAADSGVALEDVFRAGRFLRIVDAEGHQEWGVISGVTQTPTSVQVTLATTPSLAVKTPGTTCGISPGFNIGVLANPVSRVQYDLRSLKNDTTYGALVAPLGGVMSGDSGRTELVRVELDPNGQELTSTLELVAEYAVDLKFGITTSSVGPSVAAPNPTVARYPITSPPNANVYTFGASVTAGGSPERIRSVQVRLATRTRAPDRSANLTPGPDGRLGRFELFGVPGAERFARVRTLYADVALPNLLGATW